MAVFLFLALFLTPFAGVFAVKTRDQSQLDHDRKTYKLSFPSDLDEERVMAWIRSISGTLKPSSFRFTGAPTVAFEAWATNRGITHHMKVPWQNADYIVTQLRSLVPGLRVTPVDDWPRETWTRGYEIGLAHSSRQLRISSTADMSSSLLASMQGLKDGEVVLMQWVMTPTVPSHLPVHLEAKSHRLSAKQLVNGNLANRDEVNDRREKLAEPNMVAVLRVAAKANTGERADHLIYRIRASLASVRGPSTKFIKRTVSAKVLQQRLDNAAGVVNFPIQLSTPEVAALLAWPIGNPFVSGLAQTLARHLPAPESVPRAGRVLGRSNFPGNERLIALDAVSALKHMHVMGPTGVGKTVLLANLMKQDMEQGFGVVLIENKGDLFHSALNYVPRERMGDVVILDVNDSKFPVGFNIMQQGDPRVVIDELGSLFERMYDTKSVWTREVLYHGLRTLAQDPRLAFVDLAPLLSPMTGEEQEWRNALIKGLKDQELRNFWVRFESQPRASQERIVQPVMDRIWQLNARPELRNIIGQSTSSFQMAEVVKNNRILLVNLSGLPRDTASLTGTLVMNSLWHAAKTTRSDRPTFLYLDEFQDFLNLPIDPEDMLAKARGFGLGMTLAHQHLGQLPNEMKNAVMANARTKLVFQTSRTDATAMQREFGDVVSDQDFMSLGRYEAISRVATGDGVSSPMTLSTLEPAQGNYLSEIVVATSRNKYGRAVTNVENEISERRNSVPGQNPSRKRPRIGESWG